jgi:hypothetical protein
VTDLKYPMVDLFGPTMMPLVYLNILVAWYLLLLAAPWLFMQAWMKGLESVALHNQSDQNRRAW